jgi:hypothetical protein
MSRFAVGERPSRLGGHLSSIVNRPLKAKEPSMRTQTPGNHQGTRDAVFQHPIARNLQWRDVRSMLAALSDMTEEQGENCKFTRNGHTLTVHPPRRKDFSDVQELMQIRHFLERSDMRPDDVPDAAVAEGVHLLVVIDHRHARIYKTELHGSVPQQIVPYDDAGAGRHLHHVHDAVTGQRKPELKSFYTAVAKTMERAEQVLLFGSGTGASSAMDQLLAELDHHHKQVRQRVIGAIVVDEQHLTEDQLLAKAREIYAKQAAQGSDAVRVRDRLV